MSDSLEGGQSRNERDDSIETAAHRVVGGIGDAVGHARQAARQAGDGIGELRRTIRAQPLTMGFIAVGIGYLLGVVSRRSPGR